MKRVLALVLSSAAATATMTAGATVASAERPDMCVSVNGELKVQHGSAECSSVAADGGANVARAKGEDSVAIAGLSEGHSRNKAMVNGDRSYAEAGSTVFWPVPGIEYLLPGDGNTARVNGDDSTAIAIDGEENTATVHGDRSAAVISGSRCRIGCSTSNSNTATVVGDDSTATISYGSDNVATVTGEDSSAAASGNSDTATVVGDRSSAAAVAGSGETATVEGDDSHALVVRSSGSTAEVYSDRASATAGPRTGPEQPYACADEPAEHAVDVDLCG